MARPKFKITDEYDYFVASRYLRKHIDTWGFWPSDDHDRKDAATAALFDERQGYKTSKLPDLMYEPTDEERLDAFDQINKFMEEYLDAEQLRKLHLTIRQKRKGHKDGPYKDIKVSMDRMTHQRLKDVAQRKGKTLKNTIDDMVARADRESKRREGVKSLSRSWVDHQSDKTIQAESTQLKRTKTGLNTLLTKEEHSDLLSEDGRLLIEQSMRLIDDLITERRKAIKARDDQR